MAVYQDILNWSQSRPDFMRDALRRIISNDSITSNDIDELALLIKSVYSTLKVSFLISNLESEIS